MKKQKSIKIYFDTEFTGLTQNTTLVSIGMVTEYNNVFYAEFNDYNKNMVSDWIQQNVIANLKLQGSNYYNNLNYFVSGNKTDIHAELVSWLLNIRNNYGDCNFQFVSDVSHYDFMLLINLFVKDALNLPHVISPYCHDINQDIAKFYNISDYEAFDLNREKIVREKYPSNKEFNKLCDKNKHNALWDAYMIYAIDQIMNDNKPMLNLDTEIFNLFLK